MAPPITCSEGDNLSHSTNVAVTLFLKNYQKAGWSVQHWSTRYKVHLDRTVCLIKWLSVDCMKKDFSEPHQRTSSFYFWEWMTHNFLTFPPWTCLSATSSQCLRAEISASFVSRWLSFVWDGRNTQTADGRFLKPIYKISDVTIQWISCTAEWLSYQGPFFIQ